LVVEVVSPGDTFSDVEQKAASWLEAGTKSVVVADPRASTLRIYRDAGSSEVLHVDDVFDAGDVVPGWTLSVRDALAFS
jgi:Uma2 family endonuclease